MARTCTISCPMCRQSVAVWISGPVTCGACGAGFEVGVYSPPPERFSDHTAEGLSISGNWLQIRNHAYPLTDIVGTSLRRQGWGWRPYAVALLAIFTIAAGFARQWPVAGVLLLVSLGLLHRLRKQPEHYVVSWITRGGREDRQCLNNREAAQNLLEALRSGGNPANQSASGTTAPTKVGSPVGVGTPNDEAAGSTAETANPDFPRLA